MSSVSALDDLMESWEDTMKRVSSGVPGLEAYLGLAASDLKNAAASIDCPYCSRHMVLEAEEVARVLHRLKKDGNRPHVHGLGERVRTLLNSFQIVANVLLGGLRRARIIS